MSHKPFARSSNIRDFRVDQGQNSNTSSNQSAQQSVKSRQTLMSEWTSTESSIDALWNSWSEENKKPQPSSSQSAPKEISSPKATAAAQKVDLSQPTYTAASQSFKKSTQVSAPQSSRNVIEEEGIAQASEYGKNPWAIELAIEEKRLEKAGAVDMSNAFGRQEILKARTREFAQSLQKMFREQIELFNESRKSASHSIHVYKVAGAPDDFMLFRNGLKLLISAQKSGKIQFAFNQFIGQLHAPTHQSILEIDAAWGAFDQLIWTYRGERVQMQDIVRYFLTEFTRQSFR